MMATNKAINSNNTIFMKIESKNFDTPKTSVSIIEGKEEQGLIPLLSMSFALAIVNTGAGTGMQRDNTNKRFGAVRIFLPNSLYSRFLNPAYDGKEHSKIEIMIMSVLGDTNTKVVTCTFKNTFISGMRSYTRHQYAAIEKQNFAYMIDEVTRLANITTKDGSALEWFEPMLAITSGPESVSPYASEVTMLYLTYHTLQISIAQIQNNANKGNLVAEIGR